MHRLKFHTDDIPSTPCLSGEGGRGRGTPVQKRRSCMSFSSLIVLVPNKVFGAIL